MCRSLPRLRVMAVLPRAFSSGRMHPPRVSLTRRGGRRTRWEVNYPYMSMRLCSVACAYGRDGLVHHKPASLGVILTLMCTGCDLKRLAHTSALQRGRPRSRAQHHTPVRIAIHAYARSRAAPAALANAAPCERVLARHRPLAATLATMRSTARNTMCYTRTDLRAAPAGRQRSRRRISCTSSLTASRATRPLGCCTSSFRASSPCSQLWKRPSGTTAIGRGMCAFHHSRPTCPKASRAVCHVRMPQFP
mmetsp:Transcript_93012/g.279010  ORF Transcript_93012/g.279010 Transcript_93012/m.279010 type:complete len:249 (+) Transcript_93012:646-1392(+)